MNENCVSFAVLVQSWDHHVKDGFKKSKNGFGDGKSYSTWDGSRTSKVADELERQSSAVGYGSSGKCCELTY